MSFRPRIILAVTISDSVKLLGRLPTRLTEDGWEVHLVSSPGPQLSAFSRTGISVNEIEMRRQPAPIRDFLAFLAWLRLIRRLRPQIVCVGTPKASLLGLSASWFMRVPFRVYTLRGLRGETSTGLLRVALLLAERLTSSVATHVIAVSNSLKVKYVQLGLSPPAKVTVLGRGSSHGVNIRRFQKLGDSELEKLRVATGLVKNVPVLGFVGRFCRDKGADTLLTTRKYLASKGIDHEFLIVGYLENSHHVFREIEKIGRKCVFIEDPREVAPYFSLIDILLVPSMREGFPNVVLEAAVAGVPTITTNATGAVDAVHHGKTGLICNSRSNLDFAQAVEDLIGKPRDRQRMGAAARKIALTDFNEEAVISRWSDFLTSLLVARIESSRSQQFRSALAHRQPPGTKSS